MSLKFHNQLTEDDRINYFHSLLRGDTLHTINNFNGPTQENLREILAVFTKENLKTPIDGDSETQISETCVQSSKSKVSTIS